MVMVGKGKVGAFRKVRDRMLSWGGCARLQVELGLVLEVLTRAGEEELELSRLLRMLFHNTINRLLTGFSTIYFVNNYMQPRVITSILFFINIISEEGVPS